MGKKRRDQRHRQATAISTISTSLRRVRTHRHAPSTRSDCVTGVPLHDGLPTIVIRDYNEQRPLGNRQPLPLRMHRHAVDGHLGGCKWSPEMHRYIGDETVRSVREISRVWYEWWTYPDIEHILCANYNADVVYAVLAIERDNAIWQHQAELLGKSVGWLNRQLCGMRHFIHQLLQDDAAKIV